MVELLSVLMPFIVIGVVLIAQAIRILREYERGVVFRLGRLIGVKGPGLILLIPGIDKMVRVDLRTITLDVPVQELITKDNVPAKVNAVCYFRVLDPSKAVNQIENYLICHLADRADDLAQRRGPGRARRDPQRARQDQPAPAADHRPADRFLGNQGQRRGGQGRSIPEQMQRAIAQQAEAERGRRAKVIIAEGEMQASKKLAGAAAILSAQPAGMQLRFLQTAQTLGGEKNTTLFFPLPMDLIQAVMNKLGTKPAP